MKRTDLTLPKGYRGLLEAVARELGTELVSDAGRLMLSRDEIEAMMQRCSICCHRLECALHLISESGQMTAPPGFCPNLAILEQLSEAQEGMRDDSV